MEPVSVTIGGRRTVLASERIPFPPRLEDVHTFLDDIGNFLLGMPSGDDMKDGIIVMLEILPEGAPPATPATVESRMDSEGRRQITVGIGETVDVKEELSGRT